MSNAVLAALLILVALTFWRPPRRVHAFLDPSHMVSTGHAFMLLGALLGLALEAQPISMAQDMAPIVAFVAGWVGFASGMRFDARVLRTVPRRAFVAALVPAFAAATVVGLLGLVVLIAADVVLAEAAVAALVLAAAAASSGPTLAAVLRTRRAGRLAHARALLRMLEFSAGIADALVVVLAVVAFTLLRPAAEPVAPAWLLAVSAGGGALLGVVTWLLLGGRATGSERLLLGLAMLAFTAGFGGWLLVSPAAVAAIAAVVLANLPGERGMQLFEAVRRVERPAVVILMVVIGFHLAGALHWVVAPLLLAMTLLRLVAKQWSGDLVTGPVPGAPGLAVRRGWAQGLVPQGMLGLAIALSFFHVWRDEVARSVLAAVALGSVVNELLAPVLLMRVLRAQAPGSGETADERAGGAA